MDTFQLLGKNAYDVSTTFSNNNSKKDKMMKQLFFKSIFIFTVFYSSHSAATVLTFDMPSLASNNRTIPQSYGDNVTSTSMDSIGLGVFNYGEAGGFTPNITASYLRPDGNPPALWIAGYNDLTNVIYNPIQSDTGFTVTLTAELGFKVSLAGLDIGNAAAGALTLPGLSIFNETNTELFSQNNINLVARDVQSHAHFDFTNIVADSLTIVIDTTGLTSIAGNSKKIALDNVQFSQVSTVPVPAAIWLFGSSLIGLIWSKKIERSSSSRRV